MKLLTVQGIKVPKLLLVLVAQTMMEAERYYKDETRRLDYVRRNLERKLEHRRVGQQSWAVAVEPGVPEVRVLRCGGVDGVDGVLVVQAEPQQLTPEDIERAYDVVGRPEYWCRAKLFVALEAARVKGVLREVLDEMEVSTYQADQVERHLEKHWRKP